MRQAILKVLLEFNNTLSNEVTLWTEAASYESCKEPMRTPFSQALDKKPVRKFCVVIVGGSALLLHDLSTKQVTKDINVFAAEESVRGILYEDPDFNAQCQAFCTCLPYNFEDRLVEAPIETMAITYLTPSLEDIAVMKLYRWEDPDKADLTSPEFLSHLNWDLLDRLVNDPDEAAASRIAQPENDREFKNLLHNYEQYRSECRK